MKNLPPATYIGVYDPEAENCGFADKYEIEACRRYLWNHNMTINPVGTDIVLASYRHRTVTVLHAWYGGHM